MLPSNEELAKMLTPKGLWVCWAYVNTRDGRHLCAWNRDINREPLRVANDLMPVGYIAIDYDKLP